MLPAVPKPRWAALALCPMTLLIAAPAAVAHDLQVSGGAAAPGTPEVAQVRCDTGDLEQCPRGQILRVAGENLESARTVVFLGGRGRRDDRRVRAAAASPHRVVVRVPTSARSGSVRVVSTHGGASAPGPSIRVLPASAAPTPVPAAAEQLSGVFPVLGRYDFGTAVNRFGGGRGHQGQDVFAKCGTPIV